MELKIYTRAGLIRHTTDTTRKESTRVQQLMNDNYVQIVFNHTEELGFKAGDNIVYKGEKFSIIQDYKAEVVNECEYHYELKFEGSEGYFKTLPFFHYITNGEQTEKEPEVNYTAALAMTAEMAITSLRKASGDDTWKVGELAKGDESKYLNFSADSIFDAFGKIADEFKTEWWIKGKTINFSRCEHGDLQTLSAKAGGGLSSVEIASSNEIIPNRIHAYGSTRNITKKYTAQGLAYNTRLRLPAGIEYVDLTGGAENVISKTVFFDNDEVRDIYPRRIGTITAMLSPTSESGDKTYYFYDKNLDFDPYEQLIKGSTMMVHFESGMLQGRDFEVAYDKNNKRFGILSSQEGEVQIPFGSIVPKVGDKYILWNMQMPESYITNAEQELLTVAQKYIDDINKKTPEITCKSFEPYFDEYGKVVTVGSRIKIEDDRLKGGYIQSRVTKYSYPLFCETQVEFTLSENVASGRLTQIENKVEDVTADNAQNVQSTRAVSRRAWRDAQELTTALEALQAELVLVGNPESQFSCSCVFKSNKNNDPNLLAISAGELQHVVYKGDAGYKWVIEGAEFTLIADTLYYIYFKCSKSTNKGNVIISQTRQEIESQEEYYLFLGGVVSSIFENTRIVNIVSGFTQIAGGNITTERIQDPTGKLIIDLTSNPPRIIARGGAKLIGAFTFESAQGLENIEGIDDIKSDISTAQGSANDAQATANEASRATQAVNDYVQALESDVNAELVTVNKRLDGVIENYFELYNPMLDNFPANEWTTEKLKEDHNGDTFTNKSTGDSWKWKIVGGVWGWDEITDAFEKELLNKIAKAQSTADGKSRNFVLQPYPPYAVGDTWSQGVSGSGDLMRCVRSRATGVFTALDWDKASRYTDDVAANQANLIAQAALLDARAAKARTDAAATDGLITIEEKLQLKRDRDSTIKETAELAAIATESGIAQTFITNLNTAKDGVVGYMNVTMGLNAMAVDTQLTPNYTDTFATLMGTYTKRVQEVSNAVSQKQVDKVQISTVNLASGTESFTLTSHANPYWNKSFPIGEVRKGEDFSISFGAIRVLAGSPTVFTCVIYNKTNTVALSGHYNISLDRMFGVLQISGETQEANLLVYAGPAGAASGNSVQFEKLMIVRGNRPALTWTESPKDMQAKVDAAKDAAAAANAAIEAMNEDGIFDIIEKQTIRTQWEAISGVANTSGTPSNAVGASYSDTLNAASKVSIVHGNLDTRFDELRNFLNGLNLYAYSNTEQFNRAAMAAKFTAYYSAETALWDKINTKYIDNIQVGGANLINGSKPAIPWTGNSGKYTINAWTSPSTIYIKKGKTYTVVAELYCDQEFADAGVGIMFFVNNVQQIIPFFKYTTPTVVSTTFTANIDGRLHAYHVPQGIGGNSYINWIKLVEGNKASLDWSESPADTQAKIDKAQTAADNLGYLGKVFEGGKTDVEGGVLLSNFMGVKNADGAVVAGMAGGSGFPFIFAGPGSGNNLIERANNAQFRVNSDAGSGQWGILRIDSEAVYVDGDNKTILEFSKNPIGSVEALLGGVAPTYSPAGTFNVEASIPNSPAAAGGVFTEKTIRAINSFYAPQGGYVMKISCSVTLTPINNPKSIPVEGYIEAVLFRQISSTQYSIVATSNRAYLSTANSAITTDFSTSVNIPSAATYILGFRLAAAGYHKFIPGIPPLPSTSEKWNSKINADKIKTQFELTTTKTIIGTNGYAIVYGSNDYLVALKDKDTGKFEIRMASKSWPTISDPNLPMGGVYKDGNGFLKVR